MHTRRMQSEPPARELLRQLATGNAVSGEALATQLGVTRAAVWKQIAALRARGDAFEVMEENLTNYTALWRPWDEFVSGRATLYPDNVLRLLPGV